MDAGGPPGGLGDRGARPCLLDRVWAPWPISFAHNSLINPKSGLWSFRTFGVVQNRFPMFAPFPAQNPAAGILPLHINLVK